MSMQRRKCGFWGFGVSVLMLGLSACSPLPTAENDAAGSDFTISASLSTNAAHVGDVVMLSLRIRHPSNSEIRLPALTDDGSPLVIRHQRQVSRRLRNKMMETQVTAEITAFELGQHPLTTNDIVCVHPDGTRQTHPMPPLTLEIVSILSETNREVKPARAVLEWPSRVPRWIWVLPLVVGLAALAGWLAKRFLSKPRTILHIPPPEPAHEVALRALRALKNKGWIEAENVEPFYVELSNIVRRYIEDRFDIRAPERTTEEFIREAAESKDLSAAQQELIRAFLEQADLVKFARFRPTRSDMEAAFDTAERLIRETIPVSAESKEGAS